MTRSVEELRRESERSRVELAGTVDDLRERITNTAETSATKSRRNTSSRKFQISLAINLRAGPHH